MIWVLMSYRSLRFHNNAEEPPGAAAVRLFCRDPCAPGRNTRRLVWSCFPSSCLYTRLYSLPPWFSFQPFSAVTLCWADSHSRPLGAGWGCFGCSGMAGKCKRTPLPGRTVVEPYGVIRKGRDSSTLVMSSVSCHPQT